MIRRRGTPRVSEEPQPGGFDSYDLRLGDMMRGERATLGKSLLDVQRELKIKATYIAAIENADPTAFETPGFIAGYVRSYARYLGMDPERAYRAFCQESGFATAHGLSASASSPRPDAVRKKPEHTGDPLANPNASFVPRRESVFAGVEPGAIGSVAVLVALIGVLGYGGFTVLKQIQKVDFAPVEETLGVMDDLPDFSSETGTIDMAGDDSAAGLTQPPSIEALDRLYRPQALEVPVLVARDGPISTLDPRDVGVLAQLPGQTTMDEAGPSLDTIADLDAAIDLAVDEAVGGDVVRVFGPDAPEVAIFAVRPAWVRVQSADGSVIFEKILEAGERYVLPATENPPLLRSGNAGSVYFAVNGTAYGPAGTGASVVKNVELSPEALSGGYAVADLQSDADLANYVAVAEAELGGN